MVTWIPSDRVSSNRQAAWFLGNSISTVVGGVVAYGIGSVKDTAVNSWQLLFIVLGTITAGMSFWMVFLLPDSPKNAIFLTKHERAIAIQRTLKNKTGVMDEGAFKWSQAWLAIRDPQTWFLVLYTFCVNLCNGGVTSVSPESFLAFNSPGHFNNPQASSHPSSSTGSASLRSDPSSCRCL